MTEVDYAARLGRRVQHDPRNWDYPARLGVGQPLRTKHWTTHAVLDQGNVGACTGHAAAGALNTDPNFRGRVYTHDDAMSFYSESTARDTIPGQFPPDDTGSTGEAMGKTLIARGLIRAFHWTFTHQASLEAIMVGPCMAGTDWFAGMCKPNRYGTVSAKGEVIGGHEWVVCGYERGYVYGLNSWGPEWGQQGRFRMTTRTWFTLLDRGGDVMQLVL